jgi:hypothetical protein
MWVKEIEIKQFKSLKNEHLSFKEPKQIVAIERPPCSGKTHLLQAIALSVASATKKVTSLQQFGKSWIGFLADRQSLGSFNIHAIVSLEEDELTTTQQVADVFCRKFGKSNSFVKRPFVEFNVSDKNLIHSNSHLVLQPVFKEHNARFCLYGRRYVSACRFSYEQTIKYFQILGDIVWFTQESSIFKTGGSSWYRSAYSFRKNLLYWYYQAKAMNAPKINLYDVFVHRFEKLTDFRYVVKGPTRIARETLYLDFKDVYFIILDTKTGHEFDFVELPDTDRFLFLVAYITTRFHIYKNSIILIDNLDRLTGNKHHEVAEKLSRIIEGQIIYTCTT